MSCFLAVCVCGCELWGLSCIVFYVLLILFASVNYTIYTKYDRNPFHYFSLRGSNPSHSLSSS